jgi:putative redox protein
MKAELKLINKMQFECINSSHKITIDATVDHGGSDQGPSPKELLLDAMMGCTAMDVVSMLRKMRQEFTHFEMDIDATKNETHPIHFIKAKINFKLQGDIDGEKILKSVQKSLSTYCGVNYMISKTCDIEYEIFLNNKSLYRGKAEFTN